LVTNREKVELLRTTEKI